MLFNGMKTPKNCPSPLGIGAKVTIHPVFSGTVLIFNDVSQKKSQFSRDAHLTRFWLGDPDLSRFAHLCNHMLTHRWPKISTVLSVYMKKSLAVGAPPQPPLAKLMTLPQAPKSDPQWLSHPTFVPQIMVTLIGAPHIIHGSLGPPESASQTVSRLIQLFSQDSQTFVTNRQT